MDEMKKVIWMLEDEIGKASHKSELNPGDLQALKDASKSLYYLTVTCAMKEGSDSYGRMPYYGDMYGDQYGARARDSRGRFMDGSPSYNGNYGHMDKREEKMYLEKMLNEARTDSEREIFRRKLDELNRM